MSNSASYRQIRIIRNLKRAHRENVATYKPDKIAIRADMYLCHRPELTRMMHQKSPKANNAKPFRNNLPNQSQDSAYIEVSAVSWVYSNLINGGFLRILFLGNWPLACC
jgi:hypothetical protein